MGIFFRPTSAKTLQVLLLAQIILLSALCNPVPAENVEAAVAENDLPFAAGVHTAPIIEWQLE